MASTNKILDAIVTTLNTQFGKVENDAKIPKHVIAKYILNTRKYALQPAILANTAKYIAKSAVSGLANAPLYNQVTYGNGSKKHKHKKKHAQTLTLTQTGINKSKKANIYESGSLDKIKQLITDAFDPKHNSILVDILRNNRFILYLAQFHMLIKSGEFNYAKYLMKYEDLDNNSDEDVLYFKITEISFIAYLAVSFAIQANIHAEYAITPSILEDMTKDMILSTKEINKITDTRAIFNKTPVSAIKRTILAYHGEQTSKLYKLPPNKVLVILTPVNWKIYSIITEYVFHVVKSILSDEHVKRFIDNYMCYINTILSGKNETPDCLLNGMQVYYGGQYYLDIELAASEEDLNTYGKFDTYTFEPKTNTLKEHNLKIVETSIHEKIQDDNIPEIIFVSSCRMAESKYVDNLFVELIYRYAKIHDIITDSVSECPETEIEKSVIKIDKSVPYCAQSDYTEYFLQGSASKTHNNPKYKDLLLNGHLSGIRNKRQLELGQLVDYITKKPYDDKTPEYINKLFRVNKAKMSKIIYDIRVDFQLKFIKIFEVLNSQKFLGSASINTLIIILNMLYAYLDKAFRSEETISKSAITNLYKLLKTSNPVSDALLTNLPALDTFDDEKIKTHIQYTISLICKHLINNYHDFNDDDTTEKRDYIVSILSSYTGPW